MKNEYFVPEGAVWEMTLRCNMHCQHCGSRAGKARKNELTLDECLDIADQLDALGLRKITLIGGEISYFKGWEKVARRLTRYGVRVNIITNGYNLDDKEIYNIIYGGLINVAISIDGTEKTHDTIRNTKGSFKRALSAIDKLQSEGIEATVVTSLLDTNFDCLEDMYNIFVEKGIYQWQLQTVNPMGNASEMTQQFLNPNKMSILTKWIRDKREEQQILVLASDDIGYYDENEHFLRGYVDQLCEWKGCQAGLRAIGIDSVGNVRGCQSLYDDKFIEGNLRTETLEEIWFKEGNFAYNRDFSIDMLTGNCKDCNKGAVCRGGCRGTCYFTTDNQYENPLCQYNVGKNNV